VLEPVLPLCERVVNDAENTMGVGALGILGQGKPGDVAGQIQPAEVEQIVRRTGQDFFRAPDVMQYRGQVSQAEQG
jgi:hypothetical protein